MLSNYCIIMLLYQVAKTHYQKNQRRKNVKNSRFVILLLRKSKEKRFLLLQSFVFALLSLLNFLLTTMRAGLPLLKNSLLFSSFQTKEVQNEEFLCISTYRSNFFFRNVLEGSYIKIYI